MKIKKSSRIRKKGTIYIMLFIIFFSFIVAIFFHYFLFRQSKHAELDVKTHLLENGDLVFRKGRSVESYLVYLADDSKEFSHIGIVSMIGERAFVIHAVPGESKIKPEYVMLEPIEEFLEKDKASYYAFYRPEYAKEIRNRVMRQALSFYQNRCIFDHSYDLKSDDKMYCTELVLKAFAYAGIELDQIEESEISIGFKKYKVILPGSFINNQSFKRITN